MARSAIDVSVLTTAHDVADARLHRLVAVLAQRGLVIEVLALGAASGAPPGASCRVAPRPGLIGRALRAAVLPWRARGRLLILLDPDLVVPGLCRRALAGAGASARGRRVVVDVHEDYVKLLTDRPWAVGVKKTVATAVIAVSLRASRQADLTVVADDHVPPHDADRRLVVRNVPLREMLPESAGRQGPPRALYVGDVRRSRGLQRMLAAMEQCGSWTLDVVGPVAEADRPWLRHWQETSPARDRVAFHGRLPPREAWLLARGAWVGLSLLELTPAFVSALPTKVLEYLACGLAVVTSPLPRAATLVGRSGSGAVVADQDDLVRTLRRWSAHPELVDAHQSAARSWAEAGLVALDQYADLGRTVDELVAGALPSGSSPALHQRRKADEGPQRRRGAAAVREAGPDRPRAPTGRP